MSNDSNLSYVLLSGDVAHFRENYGTNVVPAFNTESRPVAAISRPGQRHSEATACHNDHRTRRPQISMLCRGSRTTRNRLSQPFPGDGPIRFAMIETVPGHGWSSGGTRLACCSSTSWRDGIGTSPVIVDQLSFGEKPCKRRIMKMCSRRSTTIGRQK
jgi:hypothetical protein